MRAVTRRIRVASPRRNIIDTAPYASAVASPMSQNDGVCTRPDAAFTAWRIPPSTPATMATTPPMAPIRSVWRAFASSARDRKSQCKTGRVHLTDGTGQAAPLSHDNTH